MCPLCKSGKDDYMHLIGSCTYTAIVWRETAWNVANAVFVNLTDLIFLFANLPFLHLELWKKPLFHSLDVGFCMNSGKKEQWLDMIMSFPPIICLSW